MGFEYIVMPSDVVQHQPELSNLYLIYKYARTPLSSEHLIICEKFFSNSSQVTLGILERSFAERGIGKPVIFSMIFWGIISLDIYSPITPESPILLSSKGDPK